MPGSFFREMERGGSEIIRNYMIIRSSAQSKLALLRSNPKTSNGLNRTESDSRMGLRILKVMTYVTHCKDRQREILAGFY